MAKTATKPKRSTGRPKAVIADGWTATDPTGEPDFTETTVELTNESIATKKES